MQALSQTGLAFTQDQYDHGRYQRLQSLAALIMAEHTGIAAPDIEVMFTRQTGYATPKLGVRGAVFQDSKILLVREAEDGHRWTLPGGLADVNESPAEAVSREVREEAGLECVPTRLAANGIAPDTHMASHNHSTYGDCSLCAKLLAANLNRVWRPAKSLSSRSRMRAELSTRRVLLPQLKRMFVHMHSPELPTEFD